MPSCFFANAEATDDVKALAVPVLGHRLVPKNFRREEARRFVEDFLERALASLVSPY